MAETPIGREAGSRDGAGRETRAQGPASRAYLAAALAWAVPGAGHFYLGRRGRGLVFTAVVLTAVVLGWQLDGLLYRPEAGQPLALLGSLAQLGFGAAYLLLRFVLGATGDATAVGFEYGKAFLITAGLMNYLLVLDAWDIAQGKKP